MRVQSIWTAIQIRYPARDPLFRPSRQVPLREVHRVAKLHHVAQEVRPMAEALQDSRHFAAPGLRPPLVVDLGNLAGRVYVFNQFDLGVVLSHGGERLGRLYHAGI
jgi:hypothetical protein